MSVLNAQQRAFIKRVTDTNENLICEAAPGSGKSTTLRAAVSMHAVARPQASQLVTSYAKKVVEEHDSLSAVADIKGIHALGRAQLVAAFPRMSRTVNEQKLKGHLGRAVDEFGLRLSGQSLAMAANTVSLAKAMLVHTEPHALHLVREYGPWPKNVPRNVVARLILDVMRRTGQDESCFDFDDMIWMPYVRLMHTQPSYDVVYFDELQDASAAQAALALRLGTRFVGVGDGQQRLYEWNGADPEIVGKIIAARAAKTMTLPVTYRCSRRVVEEACTIFPGAIVAAEDAPEGEIVKETTLHDLANGQLHQRDFVLSRTNFGALRAYLALTDAGAAVPLVMEGKSFKNLLESFVDEAGTDIVKHAARVLSTVNAQAVDVLWHRAGCTIDGYRDLVRQMFATYDKLDAAVILTVHQAKGRGADGVHILQGSFDAMTPGRTEAQQHEERQRLLYTAITRARTRLTFVQDDATSDRDAYNKALDKSGSAAQEPKAQLGAQLDAQQLNADRVPMPHLLLNSLFSPNENDPAMLDYYGIGEAGDR